MSIERSKEWWLERAKREGDTEVGAGLPDPMEATMTEEQIRAMVDRFLQWKLPADFRPDGGISFKPIRNEGTAFEGRNEPVGTNLLTATQAEAMVRFMVEGLPITKGTTP